MAGLPTIGGVTAAWRDPMLGDASSGSTPGIGSDLGNASFSQAQQQEVAKLLISMLADPTIQRMLAQSMQGQGATLGAGPQPGAVQSPLSQPGLWGSLPQGGNVQWMGGMPPGYNNDVAKQLARTAIAGNLAPGIGQALQQGIGGKWGNLLGSAAQLMPMLMALGGRR